MPLDRRSDRLADIERWTITPAHRAQDVEGNTYAVTTHVDPRLEYGSEPFEVVRAADFGGALELISDLYSFAYAWPSAGKANGDKAKWHETMERARNLTGGR